MKKLKITAAVLALAAVAVTAYAALDAYGRLQVAVMVPPQEQAEAGTLNGAAVDKMPFTGTAAITFAIGAQTNAAFSATLQIQHAPASTGTFANVTGATSTLTGTNATSATIPYDMTGGNRYLRASVTTTNGTAPIAVTLTSFK